jgi:hypothetical protein
MCGFANASGVPALGLWPSAPLWSDEKQNVSGFFRAPPLWLKLWQGRRCFLTVENARYFNTKDV